MGESHVLDGIPFEIDEAILAGQLQLRRGRGRQEELGRLIAEAKAIGRPRAMYQIAPVEERGSDYVVVNGRQLCSRVLAVNLENVYRVFAFVATGGMELEAWQESKTDMLEAYYADVIAEFGVRAAMNGLNRHLTDLYSLSTTSMMNPGSLADWPITEQRSLFAILGDTESAIGVRLTPSMLMVPRKSVSGIIFPTGETFASCQLCPREGCPNRRAPYDAELFERKYRAVA